MPATVPRTPIKTLRPLSDIQVAYLKRFGGLEAMNRYHADTVWWYTYFTQQDETPIPFERWDEPGLDVSYKYAFLRAVEALSMLLMGAKTNRAVAKKLVSDGLYPPNPGPNPFIVPDYFAWWQAENAFRRGFMELYEESFLTVFKARLKQVFNDDGNILTQSGMENLSEEYKRDPFISEYFADLADDISKGNPSPWGGLKALYNDMLRKRARGYQQFSPYFVPLRWAKGAGLVGVEPEHVR